MKLKPLIAWPGGQSKEVKKLEPFFPEHDIYVEPYVGGGSFFFRKELARVSILGDTSSWLIGFYDKTRRGGLRKCKIPTNRRKAKAAFQRALDKPRKTPCDYMTLTALSFGCKRQNFKATKLPKEIYKAKFGNIKAYEKKLRKAWLTNRPYDQTMKRFDGPETWHLLDPPWPVETSRFYDGGVTVKPEQVAKTCRKMQGTVWVLYNNSPAIRAAFSDFYQYTLKTHVSAGNINIGAVPYTKLLITNRPLGVKRNKHLRQLQGLGDIAKTSFTAKLIGGAVASWLLLRQDRAVIIGEDPAGWPVLRSLVGDMLSAGATGFMASVIADGAIKAY